VLFLSSTGKREYEGFAACVRDGKDVLVVVRERGTDASSCFVSGRSCDWKGGLCIDSILNTRSLSPPTKLAWLSALLLNPRAAGVLIGSTI